MHLGQQVMVNFVELQPVLASDNGAGRRVARAGVLHGGRMVAASTVPNRLLTRRQLAQGSGEAARRRATGHCWSGVGPSMAWSVPLRAYSLVGRSPPDALALTLDHRL